MYIRRYISTVGIYGHLRDGVCELATESHPEKSAIVSWEELDSSFEHIHIKEQKDIWPSHNFWQIEMVLNISFFMNWEDWGGAGTSSFLQTLYCHTATKCSCLSWFYWPPEMILITFLTLAFWPKPFRQLLKSKATC